MKNLPGHILVVEDNRINRLKLSRSLEQQGHTITLAENGRQALEMVRIQPFDVVLLDIVMPELDGYQVLKQMKSDKQLRDIPVIVISALDEMDSIVQGIELGAEDFLPKSFDPVLLRARLGACLEKKRLRDQEVEYLRQVARLTNAAGVMETGTFDPSSLNLESVATRDDALGQLARVFQRMAQEVYAREQQLKQQVQELRIEIDRVTQAHQVSQITETEYFQQLRSRAQDMRNRQQGKR
jgi:CheY-like chemotaxis protein